MNLSPFDMKNLLHHILSGKEFGVERSGESVPWGLHGDPRADQHQRQRFPYKEGIVCFLFQWDGLGRGRKVPACRDREHPQRVAFLCGL